MPKQQKKAASKAKPHWQNPGQSLRHQTQGPAPDCSPGASQMLRTVRQAPFPTTQEKFKGEAPETEGSSHQSSSLTKSPGLSCFLFPMSRSSLQNAHTTSEEPGHLTPSRHLQSLLQKAEQVRSEPSGQHEEFFHPASPQLFYPSTLKNNRVIQLFKTKFVCVFPVVVGGLVCSCYQDKNKRPQPRATGFPPASVP